MLSPLPVAMVTHITVIEFMNDPQVAFIGNELWEGKGQRLSTSYTRHTLTLPHTLTSPSSPPSHTHARTHAGTHARTHTRTHTHTHTIFSPPDTYGEKVVPYLLGHVAGWFEDNREGEGELQGEKDPHQVIEHTHTAPPGEILKHVA